ncbi:MAG TPA: hypothetical protein VJ948_08255 [Acidimicrobiia bacterium]|nr:hypothetical protein [Acidimicrobiia bacterium]
MRIVDIHEEWADGTKKVVADVVWERRSRKPQQIAVAVQDEHAGMLGVSPNAFLVGAIWPAMYHFERRISVEGELCPYLVDNLKDAMRLVSGWYRDARPIVIEGGVAPEPLNAPSGRYAALMFSGGLDSLASLKVNRDTHTEGDPEWFRYGIVVGPGFDAFDTSPTGAYWREMEAVAQDASLELVPVSTNVRDLEPASHFLSHYLNGALLATVGHTLTSAVDRLAIASSYVDRSFPWGSHPDLDPLFSSCDLIVIHDLPTTERLQKTAYIADWSVIHDRLKVCFVANRLPSGQWNCGRCEKCIRTMLTLTALGKLEKFDTFGDAQLTPDRVMENLRITASSTRFYPAIIEGLEKSGQTALADVTRTKLSDAQKARSRLGERVRRFDRKFLGGAIHRAKRFLDSRVTLNRARRQPQPSPAPSRRCG